MKNRLWVWGAVSLLTAVNLMPEQSHAQTTPYAVQACSSNPYCTATVIVLSGITYWAVTQNGRTTYYEYLEDPEGESSDDYWSDYIWADNDAEAWSRCQQYANNMGTQLVNVQRRGRGKRYECQFRRIRA